MKHFGDITKIDGKTVPIVDIVVGGSPCQDLSVAGNREGLAGERSGLFMEQIRLIKEMRNADRERTGRSDEFLRPRFMVWENVEGVFSSNGGEDFRCVLEETARIADSSADVPRLPDGQTWSHSGIIMGDRWSIAWRLHDAQFWGVPQRRKRIALVADFGGQSAPEVLFESDGLQGNPQQSQEERKGTPEDSRDGSDRAISFQERSGKDGGVKESSFKTTESELSQPSTINTLSTQGVDAYNGTLTDNKAMTLTGQRAGVQNIPCCMQGVDTYNGTLTGNKTMTLTGAATDPHHIPCVCLEGNGARESHKGDEYKESDVMYTLNTVEQHSVCYSQDAYDKYTENEKSPTLKNSGGNFGGGSECLVVQ